jgi:DNA ligase (NAD+)
MYTPEQASYWQNKTQQWLQLADSAGSENLDELRALLRFHEHRYYILNDPLLADEEYDRLFKKLQQLEERAGGEIPVDSPTQRVGSSLTKSFPTVTHLVPMLSLENSYNSDDLLDWDRKVREGAGNEAPVYCVEPKFDGASISLIYENDLLVRAATRGDGVAGDEITPNIRQIRSVPLSAPFSKYQIQQIEIRGEVLLTKENFRRYNEQLAEQNLPPLANPRNAAAGSLRIKDPLEVRRRNLEAFLYHVSFHTMTEAELPDAPALQSHSGSLELLWNLGFRSPQQEKRVFNSIDGVIQYCQDFEANRDALPYEIDGMVIKVDQIALQEKLGMTAHHPRWAIAFKFKARQATSRLSRVEFQVGRTGAVTPVAKIDPVSIGGVSVSSISLHNEDFIREKDIQLGDQVLVERAGDVIPYIVKSLPDLRTGTEAPIVFPTQCPACQSTLVKEPTEAVWRCNNDACPAQILEKLIHFVSKDAMDIRSLGESNIRKFYDQGLLTDIPSIYQIDYDRLSKLEGFGARSIENLRSAIELSKQNPLHRLITALGIRFVGETTAKTLANQVTHLLDYTRYTEEELLALPDVGVKVAQSIHQYFHNPQHIAMLQALEAAGVQLFNVKKEVVKADNLHGQTFLFTGTLQKLKRSEAEALVEQYGGKLLSGVSTKLQYLVAGEDAGSKLEKAKKLNTVKIISEDEFLTLIQGSE